MAVGIVAGAAVFAFLLADGPSYAHGFYGRTDAPWFLAVARHPFGAGGHGFPGDPLVQGVAYRYGRILLPLLGWILALGHTSAVPWSLAVAFTLSAGAWVALTAEFAARSGLRASAAAVILACPFTLLWLNAPSIVAEPMAAALVLLAYLLHRDGGHDRGVRFTAAAALLAARRPCSRSFLSSGAPGRPTAGAAWFAGYRSAART